MALIASDTPRQPGGTPAGGQFSHRQSMPPEGHLAESATGSFAFPPRSFDTVEEYLDFFEDTPISDRILSNADHAYRKWRQDAIDAEVEAAYDVYGNDPKVVAGARKNPFISEREAREFVIDARADAEAKRPTRTIPPHLMRTALRAHQMWNYAGTIRQDGAEEEVLAYHPRGSTFSVQEIVDSNSTREWANRALTDSDLAAVDAMQHLASALDERSGL